MSYNSKAEKVRKLIDKIALYSLLLDITIASITSLSLLHIGNPEEFLVPVNYLLTIVVVLSLGLFIFLFWLKHEEKILDGLLGRKYKYNKLSLSIVNRIKAKIMYQKNKNLSK
jgi:hypothetical protein